MNALILTILALTLAAPPPHDPTRRVHDFANLLPPDIAAKLEGLCQAVEKETTAQLAVVTVSSLDGKTVEDYANELFNQWGIGRKGYNNGVLFLIAPKERRLRIEVGYGLEPLLPDELCGRIRDSRILPFFRKDQYADGIVSGSEAIAQVLRREPAQARGVPGSAPILFKSPYDDAVAANLAAMGAAALLIPIGWWIVSRRAYNTTAFFILTAAVLAVVGTAAALTWKTPRDKPWGWLGGAGALASGTVFLHWRKYRRYGPRNCSKCGSPFELLSEQDDDPKLTSIQRLEEKIGSVDYDVWFCPACLANDTEQYINYFSGFQPCPKCKARAFKEGRQQTIIEPNYQREGKARVEGRCVNCNHKTVRTIVLSRLVESSSGSGFSIGGSGGSGFSGGGSSFGGGGSSFGGGFSGGGGASGRW